MSPFEESIMSDRSLAVPENMDQDYLNAEHGSSFSLPLLGPRPVEAQDLDTMSARPNSVGEPIPEHESALFNPLAVTPQEIWLMVGGEVFPVPLDSIPCIEWT